MVIKRDGKYYIRNHDNTKDLGGPYTNRKAATKRLGQIEFFKHKNESLDENKKLKRLLSGWDSGTQIKEIENRIRNYSLEILKSLKQFIENNEPSKGSPQEFQLKCINRELNRRNKNESLDETKACDIYHVEDYGNRFFVEDEDGENATGPFKTRKVAQKECDRRNKKQAKYESNLDKALNILEEARIPDQHQLRILKDTVKNPSKSLLGGPSVKEAEEILRKKFGFTDLQIQKLKENKKT